MHKLIVLILAMSALTACATAHGSCDLVPLKVYSQAFTDAFVVQWKAVPENSELDRYVKDSMDLKEAVRACANK